MLRQPAYTGRNRCWPCTIGNLLLVVVASAIVVRWSMLGGLAVASGGLVALWQRGYLLPLTPRVAPALLNAIGLKPNGSVPPDAARGSLADADVAEHGPRRLDVLVDHGIVTERAGSVRPTEQFAARWEEAMDRLAGQEPEALAATTRDSARGAATAHTVRSDRDRVYVVLGDGSGRVTGETWIRRPQAIAEVAAVQVLADMDVPSALRPTAASAVTMFISTCPGCDGSVVERAAGGCCGPPMRSEDGSVKTALVCEDCGAHLHVFE